MPYKYDPELIEQNRARLEDLLRCAISGDDLILAVPDWAALDRETRRWHNILKLTELMPHLYQGRYSKLRKTFRISAYPGPRPGLLFRPKAGARVAQVADMLPTDIEAFATLASGGHMGETRMLHFAPSPGFTVDGGEADIGLWGWDLETSSLMADGSYRWKVVYSGGGIEVGEGPGSEPSPFDRLNESYGDPKENDQP